MTVIAVSVGLCFLMISAFVMGVFCGAYCVGRMPMRAEKQDENAGEIKGGKPTVEKQLEDLFGYSRGIVNEG